MDTNINETFHNTIANEEYELLEAIKNYSKAFIQSSSENGGIPTWERFVSISLKWLVNVTWFRLGKKRR